MKTARELLEHYRGDILRGIRFQLSPGSEVVTAVVNEGDPERGLLAEIATNLCSMVNTKPREKLLHVVLMAATCPYPPGAKAIPFYNFLRVMEGLDRVTPQASKMWELSDGHLRLSILQSLERHPELLAWLLII